MDPSAHWAQIRSSLMFPFPTQQLTEHLTVLQVCRISDDTACYDIAWIVMSGRIWKFDNKRSWCSLVETWFGFGYYMVGCDLNHVCMMISWYGGIWYGGMWPWYYAWKDLKWVDALLVESCHVLPCKPSSNMLGAARATIINIKTHFLLIFWIKS